jgi:hypothetical protein
MKEIQQFLDAWDHDSLKTKAVFRDLHRALLQMDGARLEFHERPGISYSLRGIHKNRSDRPLFVMIDVIDDDPEQRWLSVCFYGDTIQDPDELGDLIPGGLLGSDGYCFDITEADKPLAAYVRRRMQEAYTAVT